MNIQEPIRNPKILDWDELVQEDKVHRLIYTDEGIFQEEMRKIWGGVWVFLGHESQIPEKNDFIRGKLGLRPIILTRDSGGKFVLYITAVPTGARQSAERTKATPNHLLAPIMAGVSSIRANFPGCLGLRATHAIFLRVNSIWHKCHASNHTVVLFLEPLIWMRRLLRPI